jgi:hypothetical protein
VGKGKRSYNGDSSNKIRSRRADKASGRGQARGSTREEGKREEGKRRDGPVPFAFGLFAAFEPVILDHKLNCKGKHTYKK